jgi:hypothetical protein
MMVDQADVLERAQQAISHSPHLMNKKIQLKLERDRVQILGIVPSYFAKQMAQETLRPIVTPLRIDNALVVRGVSQ